MAKRFSDSEKWNKKFIRSLPVNYKLFWLYLLDECNHAGIWEVDIDVAQLKLGIKLKEDEATKILAEKIIIIDGGKKWFIPAFIDFQYGQLSEANRAHAKIISLLKKFNLLSENLEIISPFSKLLKPLCEVAKGGNTKEMEEEKEEEKDKGGVGENAPPIPPPAKKTVPHLFVESEYFDYEKFEKHFAGTDYEPYNLKFYYESVLAWSNNGNKKIDWIATAQNFMLRDFKENKPVLKNGSDGQPDSKNRNRSNDTAAAFAKIDRMPD